VQATWETSTPPRYPDVVSLKQRYLAGVSLDLDGVRELALRNARPYHWAPAIALAACRDSRAVIGLVTVRRGFAGARVALRAPAARPDRRAAGALLETFRTAPDLRTRTPAGRALRAGTGDG
jgi:hypothetical protein